MNPDPTPWWKRITRGVLLAFVAVTVVYAVVVDIEARRAAATATGQSAAVAGAGRTIVATYFYGKIRCVTCLLIERSARDIIDLDFRSDLDSGRLVWRAVNFESPGNEHYVQEYELAAQSLVLAEYRDGVQVRWKNLEKVWETIGDQEKFHAYVDREVKAFLAGEGA